MKKALILQGLAVLFVVLNISAWWGASEVFTNPAYAGEIRAMCFGLGLIFTMATVVIDIDVVRTMFREDSNQCDSSVRKEN